MKKKAHELEFISRINRDGFGVTRVENGDVYHVKNNKIVTDDLYELMPLSISQGTFIAFNINVYVVKLK